MDRKSEYRQKLLDPRWQQMRLRVLERDAWTCQQCGANNKTLHVHHQRYQSGDPWETSSELLVTMCADCHDLEPAEYQANLDELLVMLGFIGVRSSLDIIQLLNGIYQTLYMDTDGRSATEIPYTVEETAKALSDEILHFREIKSDAGKDWYGL